MFEMKCLRALEVRIIEKSELRDKSQHEYFQCFKVSLMADKMVATATSRRELSHSGFLLSELDNHLSSDTYCCVIQMANFILMAPLWRIPLFSSCHSIFIVINKINLNN